MVAYDAPEWKKLRFAIMCPLLSCWTMVTLRDVGLFLEYPANTPSCGSLPGSDAFAGSEDLHFWRDGQVVVTAGDLGHVFKSGGVAAAEAGRLYVADLAAAAPRATALEITNFPEGLRFQPHGLFISKSRIYVTSHPGGGAGSRVEIFEGVERRGMLAGARWVRSVTHPLLACHGCPNDVVEGVDENEIYVTRWLPEFAPIPAAGRLHPATWEETFAGYALFFANMFKLPTTRVYRCTFGDGATACAAVGKRHVGANGLAASEDRRTIYVADPLAFGVYVYARRADGTLRHADTIGVPHAVDNPMVLPNGDLAMGTLPILKAVAAKEKTADFVAVPGTLLVASRGKPPANDTLKRAYGVRDTGDPRWTFTDVVVTDGTQGLSQVSSGALYGATALLGSPYTRGALLCDAAAH
jgi:hypothetical protein